MKSAHLFRSHKSLRLSRASSRRLITIETRQRSIRFLFLQERVKRDIINYAEMYSLEREFEKGQQNQTVGNPQIRANQFVLFQKKKFIIKKKQTKNGM